MFNGIIKNIGLVKSVNSNSITFKTLLNLNKIKIGSSISCDGICLTIIKKLKKNKFYEFSTNISEETYKKTSIKYWKVNNRINLETSLKINDEISGHFVYGHVDGISKLIKIKKLKNSWDMFFTYPLINQKKFFAKKGSISINGISLTISNIFKKDFSVAIIPHTYKKTNLSSLKLNDYVNLEYDMLTRYIFNK